MFERDELETMVTTATVISHILTVAKMLSERQRHQYFWNFFKLAGIKNRHKIQDEFELGPNLLDCLVQSHSPLSDENFSCRLTNGENSAFMFIRTLQICRYPKKLVLVRIRDRPKYSVKSISSLSDETFSLRLLLAVLLL